MTLPAPNRIAAKEFKCLVDNIYHEARGETAEGQIAVAKVTLNRVGRFAPTICKVVYQYKQFSWTIKGKLKTPYCQSCIDAAHIALYTHINFKATHYHTKKVNPKWGLEKYAVIGNHIFYL